MKEGSPSCIDKPIFIGNDIGVIPLCIEKFRHGLTTFDFIALIIIVVSMPANKAGYRKFIMFLHYPPTSILEERSGFTDMAEEYGAEQVIYAHSHGESRFHDSIHGEYRGREYHLVSGDYLRWKPLKILE